MLRSTLLASVLFAIAGCRPCPDVEDLRIESGTYESDMVRTTFPGPFPHGDEPKVLEVDREAGTVTIAYERDGQSILETWRITPGA